MSKFGELGARLYRGDLSVDFVGRRKTWYLVSLLIVLVAVAGLAIRHLNYGIEFRGGVEFNAQLPAGDTPADFVEPISEAVVGTQIDPASNPVVVSSGEHAVRVQTKALTDDETQVVATAIKQAGASEVNPSSIGPTWGAAIAHKALLGLGVFLFLVVLFIWGYFREWRMSVAAIVALAHDLIITVGVYALTGFEVTPATVTGFLTILGYSLYDTVVVFDKVRENTRGILGSTRRTYEESANLAVNQTLVRSINTSIVALLPVGAILYVGVVQLGSGPLKDLALALFVGMAAGAYSSIFIATPLLAQLKMLEPSMQAQAKRVAARRAATGRQATPAVAGASTGASPVRSRSSRAPATSDAPLGPSATDATDAPAPVVSEGATEVGASPPEEPPPSTRPRPRPRPATSTVRPMSSTAAKRAQPQRQTRSKRGKSR